MKLGKIEGCSHCCWRCARAEDISPLSFTLCSLQGLAGEKTPFVLSKDTDFSEGVSDFAWTGETQVIGPSFSTAN